jgi:hypothetical protein
MKYDDLQRTDDLPNISNKSLANLFNIEIKNGKYEFRSNKTIIIIGSEQASQELYSLHKISSSDSWASISNQYYETTDLWWIICKFNGIINPNVMPKSGSIIFIPKSDVVNTILNAIKKSGSTNE